MPIFNRLPFIFCIMLMAALSHAERITITSDEWCPYICKDAGERPGYIIEIVKRVFEKKGIAVDYRVLPWSRAVASVNDGSITAIAAIYPGEVTRGMLVSSVMGYSTTKAFRVRGSTWRYQGVESLRLVTLGVVRGYRYGLDIDRYIANDAGQAIVQAVGGGNPAELNIKKLLSGRVDAILANPDVLYFRAQQLGITIDEIEIAGDVSVNSLHVAFSVKNKNSAEYVEILSTGVKQLRASGELQEILSQYNMSDWLKKGDEKD